MLTSEQIRAGRALVRWDRSILAEKAGLSLETVKRLENLDGPLAGARAGTLDAIQAALEAAGVEFLAPNGGGPGVRLRAVPD